MQKAELVLTKLNQKSKCDPTFTFKRLYRNLFNQDFYLNAYAKLSSKEGNLTKGVDGQNIDGFSMKTVGHIIQKIRFERFRPYPVRRVYIPKKDKTKMRPLGIPAIYDKLVQEVLRQILEAIYEPTFNTNSHGFRPGRSCQTALYQIKKSGNGSSWVIEGDIKSYFDTIDHDILIKILKRRIDDGRFLYLIKRFLKAGILEEGRIKDSITGAPQGGIISPILSNIYLNELDTYMEEIIIKNTKGIRKRENPEYKRLIANRYNRRRKGKFKEANLMLMKALKLQATDPMDPNFRRVKYIRYADDFVILIHGPKQMALKIKTDVAEFLKNKLNLELSIEKTLITNILKDRVRFLGYEFCKAHDDTKMTRSKDGTKRRSINGIIQLLVPAKVINEKIKPFTKRGKPFHRTDRMNAPILNTIKKYNAEIRGLFNFYKLANNVSKHIAKYQYYHYFSLVKTIASKHKLSIRKTIRKYGLPVKRKQGTGTRNIIGIRYETKSGKRELTYFNSSLKHHDKPLLHNIQMDNPIVNYQNELIKRLLTGKCEMCRTKHEFNDVEVHHIRKLINLKERYKNKKKIPLWVKLMIKMNRRTLVVCKKCHAKIHK